MKHKPCNAPTCLACSPVARRKQCLLEWLANLIFFLLGGLYLLFHR